MTAADTLPLKLGGVEVRVDGKAIPLLYVSPSQINAQLPVGMPGGRTSMVQVWQVGRGSNVVEMQ